jgi:hypothetical protein
MRSLPTPPIAAAVLRRGASRRRPRSSSSSFVSQHQQGQGQEERRLAPSPPLLHLQLPRRLASTTPGSSSGGGDNKADEEEDESKRNETAHFNVVAAEARGDPNRRFTINTDGQRRQKGACWMMGAGRECMWTIVCTPSTTTSLFTHTRSARVSGSDAEPRVFPGAEHGARHVRHQPAQGKFLRAMFVYIYMDGIGIGIDGGHYVYFTFHHHRSQL